MSNTTYTTAASQGADGPVTAPEAVSIGCADGGRWHKIVGLGRRQHSQKSRRYSHAVSTAG
jgi:hypothetical protein